MTFDGKAFGKEIVEVVKIYVAEQTAKCTARLDMLEKRIEDLALNQREITELKALPKPKVRVAAGSERQRGDAA
jgi:hypothetical protein